MGCAWDKPIAAKWPLLEPLRSRRSPFDSGVRLFGKLQDTIDLDAKIASGELQLCMPK